MEKPIHFVQFPDRLEDELFSGTKTIGLIEKAGNDPRPGDAIACTVNVKGSKMVVKKAEIKKVTGVFIDANGVSLATGHPEAQMHPCSECFAKSLGFKNAVEIRQYFKMPSFTGFLVEW